MPLAERLNAAVANSFVGRFFKLKARQTTFTRELMGGLTTFLTIAYILAVNANVIVETGGTCVSPGNPCQNGKASLSDPGCQQCLRELRSSLVVATAAAALVGHVLVGVFANMPLALVPGMGLNAYFTYTVVGFMGTGMVPYQEALAAVFVEGLIFAALGIAGLRSKFMELIPRSVMMSTSAGIGLYLAFIGLQSSNGLGVVTFDQATLVTLGGCKSAYQQYMYTIPGSAIATNSLCQLSNGTATIDLSQLGAPSAVHYCETANRMGSPTMWLGISGGLLMAILMALGVKASAVLGILFVTIISWIPVCGNQAAYLGACSDIPGGQERLNLFKDVVATPDASMTAGKLDFGGLAKGELWVALITFLYVDFLDATGTLFSMANFMDHHLPNFIDQRTKKFEGQLAAFTVDGLAITVGSTLGVSPVTVAIESANGIREGARTGVAALTGAFLFFVSLFFSPLLSSIPPFATGPALILVGALMITHVVKIRWDCIQEGVPAFLTMIVMPLTYSIAYGVIAGICSYIVINGAVLTVRIAQMRLGFAEPPAPGRTTWQEGLARTFQHFEDVPGGDEGDMAGGKGQLDTSNPGTSSSLEEAKPDDLSSAAEGGSAHAPAPAPSAAL